MPTPSEETPKRPGQSPSPGPKAATPGRTNTSSASNAAVTRTKSVRTSVGSPMSARGTAKRPTSAASKETGEGDDSRAETTALIDDLKSQLRKAETASDEYQKQLFVLKTRLDDALGEQAKLEDSSHETLERMEILQKENQDAARRHRELESLYENDKIASMREREDTATREDELNGIVHRLKASLADRESRKSMDGEAMLSRATSFRGRSSPGHGNETSSSHAREMSQNSAKLVLQKDKVIESLRLELAEAQIKNVELENAGGGHMQELEKMLLESRVSNAKLMEDNESYQVLLSEKTLNGDFAKGGIFDATPSSLERAAPRATPGGSNLADELENAADFDMEYVRKVESDLSAAKDQNKALTLYINKIITRLLQSETFETLFENGTLTNESSVKPTTDKAKPTETLTVKDKEKELPQPPSSDQVTDENAVPSLLQRAGSLFGGRQRPRPKSFNPAPTSGLAGASSNENTMDSMPGPLLGIKPTINHLTAPNEDPTTAPSLPLRRTNSNRGGTPGGMKRNHRRATSDMSASIVNNMYRGPPIGPRSPMSPTGFNSPRQTSNPFFGTANAAPPLILEDAEKQSPPIGDATEQTFKNEAASDSGYGESVVTSNPASVMEGPPSPRATAAERNATAAALEGTRSGETKLAGGASAAASWFSQATTPGVSAAPKGGMRPLRLVQEKAEADEAALAAQKKANRGSIMGWFNRGAPGQPQQGSTPSAPGHTYMPSAQTPLVQRTASSDGRPASGGTQEGS